MRGLTFSDSLLLAACIHGLTFFVLSPSSSRMDTPPPSMLHIKMGTNFGNAASAQPSAKKTVIAAIPHKLPDVNQVKLPEPKPEQVTAPLTIEADMQPVSEEKLQQPLIASANPNETADKQPDIKKEAPQQAAIPVNKPGPKIPTEQQPVIQAALIQQEAAMGSPLGNSVDADAGHMVRYEQLLAMWLHKFKQYPAEARMKNQEGTAILHLVIDRSGNILKSDLSAKTGHALLDEAVIEMVKQAKSVPAVPDDYPGESELEFQIPIRFTLESL